MRLTAAMLFILAAMAGADATFAQTLTLPPVQAQQSPSAATLGKGLVVSTDIPDVTQWYPQRYAVAGDKLVFYGTLGAANFHASAGTPAVELPVQSFAPGATPATSITVSIPANIPSGTGPLTVWYGSNGTKKTLSTTFKVLKQPHVTALVLLSPAQIAFSTDGNHATHIEVDLTDFDATADPAGSRPSLWTTNCNPNSTPSGLMTQSETAGSPYKVKFDYTFFGIEQSGRHCSMQIQPYFQADLKIQAGEVVMPVYATYNIANTWDLTQFTTASGKKMSASGHNGPLPCELGSAGKQGAIATGVVNDGGDLSFQLRNGLFQENCEFLTASELTVKDDWFVKSVDWQFTRDANCGAMEFATQIPSGQTVTFFSDTRSIFAIRFDATCMPDAADLTNNRHLYKAKLGSVVLNGPAGQDWHNAFK